MSKVKSDRVPHYELLYLISNKYSETELGSIKEKVEKLITNQEGVITYKEDMGKRRLAYAIKGFRYGYYQVVEFDLPGINLAKLETNFKLDHEILRHQIVKKALKSLEEIKAEAEARQQRLAANNPEVAEVATEAKTETPTDNVAVEAKLDNILDSDIILK